MTGVESYTTIQQCQAREVRNIGNEATAQARFKQAAEQRIRSFLRDNGLPAEEASEIYFTIGSGDGDELGIQTDGNIPEALLKQLGNQLLSLAVRRGICGVSYFPPASPDENEDEELDQEPEQPRVAQRREAPLEPNVELRMNDDVTLEVQIPPPIDEAIQTPVPTTKEPRDASPVMNFDDGPETIDRVVLPDGRTITIHVAPGIKKISP